MTTNHRKAKIERPSMMCVGRLAREYRALERSPVEFVRTAADPANVLDLHFVVHGVPDTPYAEGYYHGVLRFPPEYPLVPPAIIVHTPSGRFEPGVRLCLSMSDYHPESWNPLWSVSTILAGLVSFMCEESNAIGSLTGVSAAARRRLAAASLDWNVRHSPAFVALFPDLARLAAERRTLPPSSRSTSTSSNNTPSSVSSPSPISVPVVAAVVAALAVFVLCCFFHNEIRALAHL